MLAVFNPNPSPHPNPNPNPDPYPCPNPDIVIQQYDNIIEEMKGDNVKGNCNTFHTVLHVLYVLHF